MNKLGAIRKLNWDKVREIRTRAANGEKGAHLATEFGMSRMAIYDIINGINWKERRSKERG